MTFSAENIRCEIIDQIFVVSINRPEVRNAVDGPTAHSLYKAFKYFDENKDLQIAILRGEGGYFCAGADLKAVSQQTNMNPITTEGDLGPMGPTRLKLNKPVIAAIEGHAVAGGLELACWSDLRVMAKDATMGVFCRRFGVPLVDGGTIRLPRLIGQSRAMDLILTGRAVNAEEALEMGLVNRIAAPGQSLADALSLARAITRHPQQCMRNDRLSMLEQWQLSEQEALLNEMKYGLDTLSSGETLHGSTAFAQGSGRHGKSN